VTNRISPLELVLKRSQELGFLGPNDLMRQIRHSEWWCDLIQPGQRVLDLGSGGGLPGLVIAIRRDDLSGSLLDSQASRCTFLGDSLTELGLDHRWEIAHGRAEELAHDSYYRGGFDVVVSRSFGPPAATAECAAGFLRVGGTLLVSEPPRSPDRWPPEALRALGLEPKTLHQGPDVTVQELCQVELLDDRYPRAVGRPTKRPLF